MRLLQTRCIAKTDGFTSGSKFGQICDFVELRGSRMGILNKKQAHLTKSKPSFSPSGMHPLWTLLARRELQRRSSTARSSTHL